MNDLETMKALIDGKKITAQGLEKDQYLHLLDGTLYCEDGTEGDLCSCTNWEIYEETKTLKQEYEELEKERKEIFETWKCMSCEGENRSDTCEDHFKPQSWCDRCRMKKKFER